MTHQMTEVMVGGMTRRHAWMGQIRPLLCIFLYALLHIDLPLQA